MAILFLLLASNDHIDIRLKAHQFDYRRRLFHKSRSAFFFRSSSNLFNSSSEGPSESFGLSGKISKRIPLIRANAMATSWTRGRYANPTSSHRSCAVKDDCSLDSRVELSFASAAIPLRESTSAFMPPSLSL